MISKTYRPAQKIPKIRPSDMSGREASLLDVGVQTAPGMYAFLPAMTWPEAVALRDELNTFLMDARNMLARPTLCEPEESTP